MNTESFPQAPQLLPPAAAPVMEPDSRPPDIFLLRAVTRQGKIASLPAAIRNRVNQLIYDGLRYAKVIDWLAENGHPGFNKANLSRWRRSGYHDWLRAQERLEQRDFIHQLAEQQAKTNDPTYHDAAVYLAQLQFFEALNRLDGAELSLLVKENRKEFLQLLKTFTHFNRYCLQRDKFRNDLHRQNQASPSPKTPLTNQTMEFLCDKLNLK